MTLPLTSPASDKIVTVTHAVINTVMYVPVPITGRIKEYEIALGAALTGADEVYTLAYAPPGSVTFVDVTDGAATIANASSAAGNVATATCTIGSTAAVTKGGVIRITPSGGGGGAVPLVSTIRIGN